MRIPADEELSGIGAAYAAGLAIGLYQREALFENDRRTSFIPSMEETEREKRYQGWKEVVLRTLTK